MSDTTSAPAMPAELNKFCDNLLRQARSKLLDNEELTGTAFVLNTRDKTYDTVILDQEDDAAKDASAALVRQVAQAAAADVVILLSEAWSLTPADLPRYEAILDQYGSLAAYPGHTEIVSLSVETRAGTWSGQAPIERKARSRTLGPVVYTALSPDTATRGRYTGFLAAPGAPVSDDFGATGMTFLNPDFARRINDGSVTHDDLLAAMRDGFARLGATPTAEAQAALLDMIKASYPTQELLLAFLRAQLARYAETCAPVTRH